MRCSRCKHAFFLAHPSASQSGAAEAAAASTGGEKPDPELDEEDWQFSEEVRVEGDEELDAEDAFDSDFTGGFDADDLSGDFDAEGLGGAEPGGPTLGGEAESEPESDPEAASGLELDGDAERGIEAGHDDSSFGTVEDFSQLGEGEELAAPDLDGAPGVEPAGESPAETVTGTYRTTGPSDDLGEPESWDLTPGDDFGSKGSSISGLVDSFGDSTPGTATGSPLLDDFDHEAYDDSLREPSRLGRVLAGVGACVGWLATIAVVAFVARAALDSERARWRVEPQVLEVGGFTAKTSATGWVQTSRSGLVLVVNGEIRNDGAASAWPGSFEVVLLDARGERLPGRGVPVGRPLSEATLREAAPETLEAAAVEARRTFAAAPFRRGEARPFQAVLRELPEGARRILLERAEARAPDPAPVVAPVAATSPPEESAEAAPAAAQDADR